MKEKIGVFICECGPNIVEKVDVDKVIETLSASDEVAYIDRHKLLCSNDGKKFLADKIKEHGLTRLVIGACSPKQHEATFMEVCEGAGINPYLFQLANIREQCAWICENKEEGTMKAIRMVRAALGRVQYHVPLEKQSIESNTDVLVIGGGIAGITASLILASPERKVYLVERNAKLGGSVANMERIAPEMVAGKSWVEEKVRQVLENDRIKVFTESTVEKVLGFFGNFEVEVRKNSEAGEPEKFNVGAIVVATGFSLLEKEKLSGYGYGKIDNVCTALEFEEINLAGEIKLKNGEKPGSVAIIHCCGREDTGYCSKVCCLYALKFSRYLQEKIPGIKVTHFYRELSVPGQASQEFFDQTLNNIAGFIRVQDIEISSQGEKVGIKYKAPEGKENSETVDLVILVPAMKPAEGSEALAEILNIPRGKEGFFSEAHEKLDPMSTSIQGIFIVGCAREPSGVSASIVEAVAAAGKILSSLIPGQKFEPEVKTSWISPVFCTGCQTCLKVCPFSAISYDERNGISVVNEVICRGCGNCVGACPSGAANLKHFTFNQVYRELVEAINPDIS